jgi:Gas vesicle protein G
MGLISGLLTFPIAPVRGVAWIAERLSEQAIEEAFSEGAIRRQMAAAQQDLEAGRLTEEEYDAIEDELVARLLTLRHAAGTEGV